MHYHPDVVYIATSIPFDEEMRDRIHKHQMQRPKEWCTIEAYKDLKMHIEEIPPGKKAILLDCVTIMVSNLILEEKDDWDTVSQKRIEDIELKVIQEVEGLLRSIKARDMDAILVSNEVGMGLVPSYRLGRIFRDIAGRVNQRIAAEADEAYMICSGIPLKLK